MTYTDTRNARFANLDLDLPSADAPAPQPALPAQPAPRREGGVCAEGAERAKQDEKAALDAGFSPAPPIYEIGSRVNRIGVDNFRASREGFDSMPTATEACESLIGSIASEQRQDIVVPIPSLTMLSDGQLSRGGGPLPMTKRALSGLASFVTPAGGSYLKQCPTELRALNFNHWFQAAGQRYSKREGQHVNRELTLRTRLNGSTGKRENFATVGPRYTAFDIDKIAERVMRADSIPADARADVVYDGYKARIDVLFHTDVQPEKAVAGEIFKAGILVKTADDGTGSIQIGAQVWRNLCLNLIIVDHDVLSTARRRHVGSVEDIEATVEAGIAAAMEKIAHFADAWSAATVENVLDKYGTQDVESVFRGLVTNKVVHVPGTAPAEMHSRLMGAWREEPGYQRTNIVNAVTRAAHTETWRRWTDVEDLERTGGELLFAQQWNVALPEGVSQESLGF